MERPPRIEPPGGRYHATARGNERRGLDYAVVSKAIARLGQRLAPDATLREQLAALQRQLSK